MGLYQQKCGFGKRKHSVAERKELKRTMVQAMVRKLKAEGKRVDRQVINKNILDQVCRKKMSQKPKHAV